MRLIPALALCLLMAACKPAVVHEEDGSNATSSPVAIPAEAEETAMRQSPFAATGAGESADASTPPAACVDEVGKAAADRLVARCIAVSPATRPPCNAQNSCEMIQGEIDRSCTLWKRDGNPRAECTE